MDATTLSARSIDQHLRRSAAPVLLAVLAAMALAILGLLAVLAQQRAVRDASHALTALSDLYHAMAEQEASLRGWLLTGDGSFLTAYEEGVPRMVDAEARLAVAVTRDSDTAALEALLAAQHHWASQWAAAVRTGAAADIELGRQLFDDYRDAEEVMRDALRAELLAALDGQTTGIVIRDAAMVVLLVVGLGLMALQSRRLRCMIIAPIADLLHAYRAVTRGDLSVRPQPRGPAELQQLAVGLSDTIAALQLEHDRSRRRQRQLRRQSTALRTLVGLAPRLTSAADLPTLAGIAVRGAISLTGAAHGRLWVRSPSGQLTPLDDLLPGTMADGMVPTTPVVRAAAHATTVTEGADLAVALTARDRVLGVLELLDVPAADASRGHVLQSLAAHVGAALEATRLHEETRVLSRTDPLTELANRRVFDEELALECSVSDRTGRELSLCVVDLDHFKRVNDELGHPIGDQVLQRLAAVLTGLLRVTDTCYRIGGEEFALLLRGTGLEGATTLAERLRVEIAEAFAGHPALPAVTASLGVAGWSLAMSPQRLLVAADTALYAAKQAGRNRVAVAAPGPGGDEVAPLSAITVVTPLLR
jgi:diguanylate cyclase (GGDEF)-like protein